MKRLTAILWLVAGCASPATSPVASQSHREPTHDSASNRHPIELYQGRPVVRIKPSEGTPLLVLLDTGAQGVLMAADVKSSIGFVQSGERTIMTAGGEKKAVAGTASGLSWDGIPIQCGTILLIERSAMEVFCRSGHDASAGAPLWSTDPIEIDYDDWECRTGVRVPATDNVSLILADNGPVVEAAVGGGTLRLLIDTGSAHGVLTQAAREKLGLASTTEPDFVGKPREFVRPPDFRTGPYVWPSPRMSVTASLPGVDGIIGSEMIRELGGVGIDYKSKQGWFRHRSAKEAIAALNARAAKDDGAALAALAYRRLDGAGFDVDLRMGVDLLRRAAAQGSTTAQLSLGLAFTFGWFGMERDGAAAHKYLQPLAKAGVGRACYGLGVLYMDGLGVPKDQARGVGYFREAASLGIDDAMTELGNAYRHGLGVEADSRQCFEFTRRAAERGAAEGQRLLGACYLYGIGTAKDLEAAAKWMRLAAEGGSRNGIIWLAWMYSTGTGVPKDRTEARRLYKYLADKGDQEAAEALERMRD